MSRAAGGPDWPRGSRLDPFVLWAVAAWGNPAHYVGTQHVGDKLANKLGLLGLPIEDVRLSGSRHRLVINSLRRLQAQHLIQYDTGDGYRLAGERPRREP